jgi:hypothetical protein
MTQGFICVDSRKTEAKISCYCPFKILSITKKPGGKKYVISSYSAAKNMTKIAKVKVSSCGLEVAYFGKIAIAELRSCGCGATFL